MCKTSIIQMFTVSLEIAQRWTLFGGSFTIKQLQDAVEDQCKVRPGKDWLESQLSQSGFTPRRSVRVEQEVWQRKPVEKSVEKSVER
jgi:hypothetical protein